MVRFSLLIIMIIMNILLLAGPLFAEIFLESTYSFFQPRFNSSCANLPEAEICEEECSLAYNGCVTSCSDQVMELPPISSII